MVASETALLTDTQPADPKGRYRRYLETELDAAAMYGAMARVERDQKRSDVFQRLVDAEMEHARLWAEKLGLDRERIKPPAPGLRLRLFQAAALVFGTSRIVPWLTRGELKELEMYASDPEARGLVSEERYHARILRELVASGDSLEAMRAERRHVLGAGGSLRAAVLGVNDGLVSNFSLVMGVAGADLRADYVLLAGIAGLLAGAFSMAAGEYVSMRSQRDVYEHQIREQEMGLDEWPEDAKDDLVLIYEAKGLSRDVSERVAKQIMERRPVALDTMVREGLGLDPGQLGSPWGAAVSSFLAFVSGALVPILPYVFDAGSAAFVLSGVLSACALAVVGALLAAVTGRSLAWGGLRMLLAGGAAAAVTFGIGHLVGVSLLG